MNLVYIRKRLAYVLESIHCAYCDFVQPTRPTKNKFGYTIGFYVSENDWQHRGDCVQKDIKDDEPEESIEDQRPPAEGFDRQTSNE